MSDIKVVISSTARDLPEHRKEVMDACLRQGMFPTMMEHLPAADADAIAESLLSLGISGQIGQVHEMVAAIEKRFANGREDALLAGAKVVAEDQVERLADFRLIVVVPERVVPRAAVLHLIGSQAE